MRILVAEDDITTREILESTLLEWGHEIIAARNGIEAWNILQGEESPRLAILDWMMPGMDGLEVCRNIRQTFNSDPKYIMLLSGRDSRCDISAGLAAGADDYITKPVYVEVLHARLQLGERLVKQMQFEEQLLHAQKMATVGYMSAGLAHDINNLLTPISSCAQLGLRELPSDNQACGYFQDIYDAVFQASDLTRQILDYTRQQTTEPVLLNLNDVIFKMDSMLRHLVGSGIELITLPIPDLGLVKMTQGQIEQILINLAINARDAMPDGGRLIIATADSSVDAHYASSSSQIPSVDYVTLSVSDNGIGIPKNVVGHIFEPFFTTKNTKNGTGLGLWNCWQIISQNGGHIMAHSEFGHGTSFEIYLPVVEEATNLTHYCDEPI